MRESLGLSDRSLTGDLLAIAAAVFYAGYVLTLSRVRKRVSILATMAIGGLAATLFLVVLSALMEEHMWPSTLHGWLTAVSMAVIVQIFGQMLIAISLAYVPAGLIATLFLISPVISALVAWPLFGESITLTQGASAAVLLAGLEISRRGTTARPRPRVMSLYDRHCPHDH
jgi:drug/metabolite transporter (DMT)-like permease